MVVVTNQPDPDSHLICNPLNKNEVRINNGLRAEDQGANIPSSAQILEISSPKLALELLSTAIKLQNLLLVKQCIEVIEKQLDQTVLLSVLFHLSDSKTSEPSAPPLLEIENEKDVNSIKELVNKLRQKCLIEIDKNADSILKDTEFLKLSYEDVLQITTRDTLKISSETVVYGAVMRWANQECKRRTLEPYLLNIKAVLRDLIYSPRYMNMTKKEFLLKKIDGERGPTRSGILEEKEWRQILNCINDKHKNRLLNDPKGLTYRHDPNYGEKAAFLNSKVTERSQSNSTRDVESTTITSNRCDKILLNLLTCWTAVFD